MRGENFDLDYNRLRKRFIAYTIQELKDRVKEPLTKALQKFFIGGIETYFEYRDKNQDALVYVRILCGSAYVQFMTQAKSRLKSENSYQSNGSITKPSGPSQEKSNHAKCLNAKDYEGCIKVLSGQSSSSKKQTQDNCKPNKWCIASTGTDPLGR